MMNSPKKVVLHSNEKNLEPLALASTVEEADGYAPQGGASRPELI
jgi:hypothetical protein